MKDYTIVRIWAWVAEEDLAEDEEQDIFFVYRLKDRIKRKRRTAFCQNSDIIEYGDSIKELKKEIRLFRKIRKEEKRLG